jgi:basic membrane protein A and related proteins
MLKRIDVAIYNTVKDLVASKFTGGIHLNGLENEGVGFALDEYNEKLIPQSVLDEVGRVKQEIISGKIKVTDAMAK